VLLLAAGWQVREGFVLCDLPSDSDVGLLTDPEDTEW
jgi:hypothetical protein